VIQYCKTNICGVRYLEEVDIILEAVQDLKEHIGESAFSNFAKCGERTLQKISKRNFVVNNECQ
jgi:hypothetical protein